MTYGIVAEENGRSWLRTANFRMSSYCPLLRQHQPSKLEASRMSALPATTDDFRYYTDGLFLTLNGHFGLHLLPTTGLALPRSRTIDNSLDHTRCTSARLGFVASIEMPAVKVVEVEPAVE